MNDDQLLRYSRHILLDAIGIEGQTRICQSRALIVGAGGLGSPAALYLAAAGVGHITLMDDDVVDLTNLQRQIAHSTARAGLAKAASAKTAMQAINPDITIEAICQRASSHNLDAQVLAADIVLDCTDNFSTRHAINAACVKHAKPLVSGSAIQMDGQLSVYHPAGQANSPCYACVFPQNQHFEETACSQLGVLGPLVGMVGAMQAAEALKILCGMNSTMIGKLLLIDGQFFTFDTLQLKQQPECPICQRNNFD